MKRYLKKLASMLLCTGLSVALAVLLRLIFQPTEEQRVLTSLLFLLPLLAVLLLVLSRRRQNDSARRAYFDTQPEHPTARLAADLASLWRGREFGAELLAYATLVLPFTLGMVVKNAAASALVTTLSALTMLALETLVFVLLDGWLWLLVYYTWRKERLHT